jgi:hypothetical protein
MTFSVSRSAAPRCAASMIAEDAAISREPDEHPNEHRFWQRDRRAEHLVSECNRRRQDERTKSVRRAARGEDRGGDERGEQCRRRWWIERYRNGKPIDDRCVRQMRLKIVRYR